MRGGLGAHIAVAAAAALAGACLAGGPLYVSSAASEAMQVGLDRTCLTDAGLVVRLARSPSGPEQDLIAAAVDLPYAQDAVVTEAVAQVMARDGSTTPIRAQLVDRTGQYEALGAAPIAKDEALVPDWAVPLFDIGAGTRLTGEIAPRIDDTTPPERFSLTVRSTYPGIPVNPEPTYWCGLRTMLRPTAQGDPPPPMLVVDASTFAALPRMQVARIVEVRPDPRGLTRAEATQLSDDLDALATTYANTATGAPSGGPVGIPIRGSRFRNGMPQIITYAETLSTVVDRTVAPVRIAGLAAAGLLLVTAGAMVARARASELRLRVLRGVSPLAVGARVAGGAAPAVAIGVLAGGALAALGVVTLGPTPEIEPGPTRDALVACAAGVVAGTALVAGVVAVLSARTVDARPRTHWLRWVPWELLVVALAVASWNRLDRVGGVRLVGSEARGGDLLAQAFPLLALGATLVVLARPVRWLFARSRTLGRRWPIALLVGVRRLGADAAVSALALLAVALVIGSITLATTLTDSADAMLRDKASTYLGTDLVVRVNTSRDLTLPAGLDGHATVVHRARVDSGGARVDLLGVDPATFTRGLGRRPSDRDVGSLLARITSADGQGVGGEAAVVVVRGSLPSSTLESPSRGTLEVRPVAEAAWFPGYQNGATMVVVDDDVLQASDLGSAAEIWIADPPADTVPQLQRAGWLIRSTQSVEDVFEVTSFLTVRWSYAALTAFGVLIGIVLVVAQVLVLDARRRSRQSASVVARQMGFGARHEAAAVFVELAVPFAFGAMLGVGAAIAIVHFAIGHLDTLRNLQPPAEVIVDVASIAAGIGIGAVALAGLAALGTVVARRITPMEAMRSAE